jgi:uncharacterized iron-regulated membrane protein
MEVSDMKILFGRKGQAIVEWLAGAFLVIAVVGSIVWLLANSTADQGSKTNDWVNSVPDPASP